MLPFIPGKAGAVITVLQFSTAALFFYNEAQPATTTPYSKFVSDSENSKQKQKKETMVGSRTGMLLFYSPSLVVSVFLPACGIVSHTLGNYLCMIHFLKRVLEVLLLHKYSGSVALGLSSTIGFYYALLSAMVACVATLEPSPDAMYAGICLFAVGIIGNFYHHFLLANLRLAVHDNNNIDAKPSSSAGEKRYFVPRGGLFKFVAAPHYLFELIGWLGIAIVCNHANAYLIFASMASYLGGRSVSQNNWNRKKFPKEWPRTRKNLIPFLF